MCQLKPIIPTSVGSLSVLLDRDPYWVVLDNTMTACNQNDADVELLRDLGNR